MAWATATQVEVEGRGDDWMGAEEEEEGTRRTNATLSVHTWYGCDPLVLSPLTKSLSRRRSGGSETGDMGHEESRAWMYEEQPSREEDIGERDGRDNGLKRMASAIARLLSYSRRSVERVTPEKADGDDGSLARP
ncbi:hypothetical protein CSAL01_13371 [Colletotrichum salicis]|uniref:Uncharacterized protein n=1 Tax=Colletotrichum salicis TaxID=1209931 RepID=A0A135UV32_9PEZI|nr:hypothetical protein CSAL01_13371 [Colletotrichum salicis]